MPSRYLRQPHVAEVLEGMQRQVKGVRVMPQATKR